MIATEMPAAIRPYSMAVAPELSFRKREKRFFIGSSMIHTWLSELVRDPGLIPVIPAITGDYAAGLAGILKNITESVAFLCI
jgi:hypothetical protein